VAESLADETATVNYGIQLCRRILADYEGNALVFLRGQLGAGKTTLVRGLLTTLGHTGAVKSPTYTLLEPYSYNGQDAFHFDLYRVADPQELSFVGFDEIIDGPGIKLIEWPEKAESWLPNPDINITLEVPPDAAAGRIVHATFN
jgi:tRNA threonylcarbamoyladenosine biosynthesis protein TsaE